MPIEHSIAYGTSHRFAPIADFVRSAPAGLVLLVTCVATPVSAITPAEALCEAAKNQAAGQYALCLQKARQKHVQTGDPARYEAAVLKCEATLGAAWQRAIDKAARTGELCLDDPLAEADFKAVIDTHARSVAIGLAGGGLVDVAGALAACNADLATCEDDIGAAEECGNGTIAAGEECDQGNLRGATCASQGHVGGTLTCGAGCTLDTSGCYDARFEDNVGGLGSITDNETGLDWERKVALDDDPHLDDPHDADNRYLWAGRCAGDGAYCQPDLASSTACLAGAEINASACAQCDGMNGPCEVGAEGTIWQWLVALNGGAGFAGHTDWRIPKRAELVTIVDYGRRRPPFAYAAFHAATCNGCVVTPDVSDPACSCTKRAATFSASSMFSPVGAWFVDFNDASLNYGFTKADFAAARAVRGGS